MRLTWLVREQRDHLLLFFAGWGMDERPFAALTATTHDVAVLYDYTEEGLPVSSGDLVGGYAAVDLIAWSLGVPVACRVCAPWADRLRQRIAVNGSPWPIDARYGIAPEIFDGTQASLARGGLTRFRRRMCGGRTGLKRFDARAPARPLESLVDELAALKARCEGDVPGRNLFTCAWVGKGDRIIPAANQLRAWRRCGVPCTVVDAPHFMFDRWSAWEDLLLCSKAP